MSEDEHRRAQLERARGSWELHLLERPDPADPRWRAVRRALGIKSFEAQALLERLPGRVRSGAHVDLAPLRERLEALGVRVSLQPRAEGPAPRD